MGCSVITGVEPGIRSGQYVGPMTEALAHHLAQINIGTMVAPTDDPRVAEFMGALDRINALADAAPGFVWRLQTEAGNATAIQIFPNPLELVNLSVWTSLDDLRRYVYHSDHVGFLRRRTEWFEAEAKRVALWWVAAGTIPTLAQAVGRVRFLERYGPSPWAFSFARPEPPLVMETTSLDDSGTAALVERLNAELLAMADDPAEAHFSLSVAETTGANGRMVRARLDGELVGCGAVRVIGPGVGELKRMYVDPATRGRKVGAALVHHLEQVAAELGCRELKLETGPQQAAAIGLYEGAGFTRCGLWGEYLDTPDTSLGYHKLLD